MGGETIEGVGWGVGGPIAAICAAHFLTYTHPPDRKTETPTPTYLVRVLAAVAPLEARLVVRRKVLQPAQRRGAAHLHAL